jgi:hypothetical protein
MRWSEVSCLVSDLVESSTAVSQLVQLACCSKIGDSQRGCETVNTEVEVSMSLEAITRQRLMKTQQTEKI